MKTPLSILMVVLLTQLCANSAPEIKWPQNAYEWKKYKDAAAEAEKEGKAVAFIFFLHGAAAPPIVKKLIKPAWTSSEATKEAIKGLKRFCIIVRVGELDGVELAADPRLPKLVIQARDQAGATTPRVVVLDAALKNLVLAADGEKIMSDGRKIFREAQSKLRELKAAKKN